MKPRAILAPIDYDARMSTLPREYSAAYLEFPGASHIFGDGFE